MVAELRLLRSTTPGSTPSGLASGEPAVNLPDGLLWIGGFEIPLAEPWVALYNEAPFLPSPTTNWRSLWPFTGVGTTIALTAGRCYFIPFWVMSPRSITALGYEVSTSSAGSAEVAIYAADGTSYRPRTRLAYVSGLNTGATGVQSGAVSVTLQPGLYWCALRSSAAATLRGAAGAFAFGISTGGNNRITHLFNADASLADPVASDPTSLGVGTVPHIYARW